MVLLGKGCPGREPDRPRIRARIAGELAGGRNRNDGAAEIAAVGAGQREPSG